MTLKTIFNREEVVTATIENRGNANRGLVATAETTDGNAKSTLESSCAGSRNLATATKWAIQASPITVRLAAPDYGKTDSGAASSKKAGESDNDDSSGNTKISSKKVNEAAEKLAKEMNKKIKGANFKAKDIPKDLVKKYMADKLTAKEVATEMKKRSKKAEAEEKADDQEKKATSKPDKDTAPKGYDGALAPGRKKVNVDKDREAPM